MKLEVSEEAEAELELARARYEDERVGLGDEFLDEMEQLMARIADSPMQFPTVARTKARRALGARFPYQVVFFVMTARVRVIAVAHQKQRPRYWRGRA